MLEMKEYAFHIIFYLSNNLHSIFFIVMKITFQALIHKLFFLLQAKLETKALKAKRPGFTDERYHETSYYIENGKLFQFSLAFHFKPFPPVFFFFYSILAYFHF